MNSFKPHPNYDIEVFDDIFDQKQIDFIYDIVSNIPFRFSNFDYGVPTSIYDHQLPKLMYSIMRGGELGESKEGNQYIINTFKPSIEKLLDPSFIKRCNQNISMQINCSFPSTIDKLHLDTKTNIEKGYTILYYANMKWDVNFGGETLFYNNNQEIIAGVIPKPGRFVVFDSYTYHSARPPQSNCPYYRFSLAFKFQEYHNKK